MQESSTSPLVNILIVARGPWASDLEPVDVLSPGAITYLCFLYIITLSEFILHTCTLLMTNRLAWDKKDIHWRR